MSAGDEQGPSSGRPGGVAVALWLWSLDSPPRPLSELESYLSPDEIVRAGQFRLPHLRSRWIAARAGMRCILGHRTGMAPARLNFSLGEHGKPHLEGLDTPCAFNLSHSEGFAALAVSDLPVGVDIQLIGPHRDSVARDYFSAAEIETLDRMAPEQRGAAFHRCWTAKEAVLKALGTGFSLGSKTFTIDFETPGAPQLLHADWPDADPAGWQIRAFDPAPGFAGSVAAQAAAPLVLSMARWT